MRLARLDLTRYGKFTDHQINFGPKPKGAPDLHVVYGPNEAGKSTAFAAFLDMLFGIETRSSYNFQHAYPTLQIGAALELGGQLHELRRLKRPQNSLLDVQGQPISEGLILSELGSIDREAYRNMFSLDDKTLEEGGESILASKGDLGQLLFSASAGLADFSRTLGQIRAETDKFHKSRARNTELGDFKDALARLKAERDALDIVATDYKNLLHTCAQAQAAYAQAMAERDKTWRRREQIQRITTSLPQLSGLQRLRAQMAEFEHLPAAPSHWASELPQLSSQEIKLSTRHDTLLADIESHSASLALIKVDQAALEASARFDLLNDSRARYTTAAQDIPNRQLELRDAQREIATLLKTLGKETSDPASLILHSATISRLRALLESHSGLQVESGKARTELDAATRRHAETIQKLNEAGHLAQSVETQPLQTALAMARASDHAARTKLAKAELASLKDRAEISFRALRPWAGSIEALLDMSPPTTQTLQKWKNDLAAARTKFDKQTSEEARLKLEHRRLQADLDALKITLGLISTEDAGKIRAAREQAWAKHRHSLDLLTAEAFEAILRQDDLSTAVTIAHSGEMAKIQQMQHALLRLESQSTLEAQNTAQADLAQLQATIAAAIVKISTALPKDMEISELETWLAARERCIEIHDEIRATTRALTAAKADGEALQSGLATALNTSTEGPLEALIQTAQTTLDSQTSLKSLRSQRDEQALSLETRRQDFETAKAKLEDWHENWALTNQSCWLGENGHILQIDEVRDVLNHLSNLPKLANLEASLLGRVESMTHDQQKFAAELDAFADQFELDGHPLQDYQTIAKAIATAKSAAERAEAAQRALQNSRGALEALKAEIAAHHKQKAQMTTHFDVGSLLDVDEKLRQLEKRAMLHEQISTLEHDIPSHLNVGSIEEAAGLLENAHPAELEAELATLETDYELQDQRSREAFSALGKAKDALDAIGGDGAVARMEEQRRTILLEIEDRAKSHFSLRVGVHAAEQALRLYRDKHRSFMMARASDAFATISRGAYKRLATRPEKDAEVLIGIGESGSKDAEQMSKGTRFQLYLALRVAGYHEYVQTRHPVPFIADDIMETFDDFRAEETFRLFGEMAGVGQVIYFTHHRHLCEIARKVCPAVQILKL